MDGERDVHTLVVGRDAMACRFELVFNADESADVTGIAVGCLDLVEEIENRISIYRDTSELARINARAAAGWTPVPTDVLALILEARRLWERTKGAFDMATGALVRTWGFLQRQGRTPTADELSGARHASGMQWVEIDAHAGRVRFTRPGVELNPGAIGKGWALDRVMERLRSVGVENVLVHGGSSSVRASGGRVSFGTPQGWPVGIRHPLRPGRRLATVRLKNGGLGTSGSGTQFFIDRGRRLGHILDPRNGVPAEGVFSATVVAGTAAEADSLSTALYVLGEEGLDVVTAAGETIGCLLVVPGKEAGAVRVITANLPEGMLTIEPQEGVEHSSVPRPGRVTDAGRT